MERNNRKLMTGKVVNNKSSKTISVLIQTYKTLPIYKKRILYSKKYQAHDENNVAKIGDKVEIMECRPISATKKFRLVRVIQAASILEKEIN